MQQFLEGSLLRAGIFFSALLVLYVLLRWLISHVKRQGALENSSWRLHIESIILLPVHALLAAAALLWASEALGSGVVNQKIFPSFRSIAIVLCLTWCVFRGKKVFFATLATKQAHGKVFFDLGALGLFNKLLTLLIGVVALLFILHFAGLDIVPLLALGGIGAASMGFASKDILANFFGGLVLHATRPFTVNDHVEMPSKQIAGHIEEIGWCLTSIRDLEKRLVYLPNALFSNEALFNISRSSHRLIEESIRFRCMDGSIVDGFVKQIQEYLVSEPRLDHELPIYVFLQSLTPVFAEIKIKAYVLGPEFGEFIRVKQDMLVKARRIVGAG